MAKNQTTWFFPQKCPVCGKKFEIRNTEYAYKIRRQKSNHLVYFCSWHCLREAERKAEEAGIRRGRSNEKSKAGRIRKMAAEGRSPTEIADALGVSVSYVYLCKNK